jgi:hypothetical protein
MKVSSRGAPIEHGRGLQSVRDHIRREFERVHKDIVRTIEIVEKSTIDIKPEAVPEKPLPPLAERAAPFLKTALRTCQHAEGRRHHHSAVHHITVPTETAEELIGQAMRDKRKRRPKAVSTDYV